MRISDDVNEVLSMLKNIQQSICQKLAGLSLENVNKVAFHRPKLIFLDL
jgi:transcription elongation factor GreA-like protein